MERVTWGDLAEFIKKQNISESNNTPVLIYNAETGDEYTCSILTFENNVNTLVINHEILKIEK